MDEIVKQILFDTEIIRELILSADHPARDDLLKTAEAFDKRIAADTTMTNTTPKQLLKWIEGENRGEFGSEEPFNRATALIESWWRKSALDETGKTIPFDESFNAKIIRRVCCSLDLLAYGDLDYSKSTPKLLFAKLFNTLKDHFETIESPPLATSQSSADPTPAEAAKSNPSKPPPPSSQYSSVGNRPGTPSTFSQQSARFWAERSPKPPEASSLVDQSKGTSYGAGKLTLRKNGPR